MSSPRFPDRRRDVGQAVVEFALTLPIVVLMLLLMVEVGLLIVDQVRLVHLCRDATRAASISNDPVNAARNTMSDDEVTVRVVEDRLSVTVVVESVHHTDLPLIGALLPDVTMSERLTMAWEGQPGTSTIG
ncbi:MAG: hypothetical protein RL391_14 [Actinomycetota bacterium]